MRRLLLRSTAQAKETTSDRRTLVARGFLVMGLLLAVFLWLASDRTTVETRHLQGHARTEYEVVETRIDPVPRVLSAAAIVLGTFGWAGLSRARPRLRIGGAILGVFGTSFIAISAFAANGDPAYEDFEYYDSPRQVAAAMAEGEIPCARVQARPAGRSQFFTEVASCPVPAELAISDEFDDVTIRMWRDGDARSEWKVSTPVEEVDAVVGPTWLIVCEFRSTCAEIQDRIGGRMH